MRKRCGFCGRFLKQRWNLTNDEPDGWQDYWTCSLDARHKKLQKQLDLNPGGEILSKYTQNT